MKPESLNLGNRNVNESENFDMSPRWIQGVSTYERKKTMTKPGLKAPEPSNYLSPGGSPHGPKSKQEKIQDQHNSFLENYKKGVKERIEQFKQLSPSDKGEGAALDFVLEDPKDKSSDTTPMQNQSTPT